MVETETSYRYKTDRNRIDLDTIEGGGRVRISKRQYLADRDESYRQGVNHYWDITDLKGKALGWTHPNLRAEDRVADARIIEQYLKGQSDAQTT